MTLANLIQQHASAEAAAENWSAVAAIVRGLGLRQTPRLCYSVESGDAIEAAGDDPTTVIGSMLLDPNGTMLFQRLSSAAGVQWAHPRTQQWLTWFVAQGRISQAGASALINLSAPLLYAHLTAAECEAAISADQARQALVRLQQRRSDWDTVAAGIRSRIESGELTDNAAILAAVQAAL